MNLGFILLPLGFIAFIAGIVLLIMSKRNTRSAIVRGRIIDLCFNSAAYNRGGNGNIKIGFSAGSQNSNTSCPVFEYCVGGQSFKKASYIAQNRATLQRKIGKECLVYYDPSNPQNASLYSGKAQTVFGYFLSITGCIVAFSGIVLLILK